MKIDNIAQALTEKVDGRYLALMRMLLGLVLVKEAHRIYNSIYAFYLEPDFLLKWPFLEWIPLLPGDFLYGGALILGICGVLTLAGYATKITSALAWVIYAYFLFLDCSYYNNHYYLIFLLLFLFSFCDAGEQWSIRQWLTRSSGKVPAWNIGILRFQIALVYFAGGTSKLNADWLSGRTMQASLESGAYRSLADIFPGHMDLTGLLLTHGGWIFDMLVPVLLLNKKTRWWVLPFLIVFHVTNMFNLSIGVFPYMMLGATVIFFGDGVRDVYRECLSGSISAHQKKVCWLFFAYIAFQVLFPLRHHLIRGDYNVTGEGYAFSWKMKGNAVALHRFEIFIRNKKNNHEIDLPVTLNNKQYNRMSGMPVVNVYFADQVAKRAEEVYRLQRKDLIIKAYISVSLNNSRPFYLLDTNANLLDVRYSRFGHSPVVHVNKSVY